MKRSASMMPLPLTTSKLINRLPGLVQGSPKVRCYQESPANTIDTDSALQQATMQKEEASPDDELLAILTQRVNISQEKEVDDSSSSATDPYATTPPTESLASTSGGRPDAAEVLRLQKELALTQQRMVQMDMQLARERQERIHQADIIDHQNQVARYTVEQAIGSPIPAHNVGHEPYARPGSGYRRGYIPPVTPGPFGMPPSASMQWPGQMNMQQQQPSYMSTTEPLNYRRLLDRNMSANWRYIVDKIVCNNDQQASIFLQQKLKVGTAGK